MIIKKDSHLNRFAFSCYQKTESLRTAIGQGSPEDKQNLWLQVRVVSSSFLEEHQRKFSRFANESKFDVTLKTLSLSLSQRFNYKTFTSDTL